MADNKIIVVGLTGMSGSGKTTVSNLLMEKGICIINADIVARQVVKPNQPCLEKLVHYFGKEILRPDGTLNRKRLAALAFKSNEKTILLDKITHPFIMEKIQNIITEYRKSGHKLIILDAPMLFESGADKLCNVTCAVIADTETVKNRIIERDDLDSKSANERLMRQHDNDFFKAHADYIIENNGSFDELRQKVDKALKNFTDASGTTHTF